jgi:hypothetical protein
MPIAAGYIVHDNYGTIRGCGTTHEGAWANAGIADQTDRPHHARVAHLVRATGALLAHIVSGGDPCLWCEVDCVACTWMETTDAETEPFC